MRPTRIVVLALVAGSFAACNEATPMQVQPPGVAMGRSPAPAPTISTFATGLNAPRGLRFGPDGYLYVAEGGTGGSNSTEGQCDQVIEPIGPYTGGYTGRISKVDASGNRTTVVDNLPSSQTSPGSGGLVSGVADVAFVGHTLYALLAGAGCSHGIPDVPNGVIRVHGDGSWDLVADLSAYQAAHPVAHPEEEDFEPDGTWWQMVAVRGDLYAVEPNHGELVRITTAGDVKRVVDISAKEGHIVPTAVAYHGNFYVGNLSTFPLVPGASTIYHITPSGQIPETTGHLTSVLGVVFDHQGRMYALENTVCPSAEPCMPTPETGRVVRVARNGSLETIASGLMLPTGMTMGPDGALYVSVAGFGAPPGAGAIVRIEF